MAAVASNATSLSREIWPQTSVNANILEGSAIVGIIPKDENFGEIVRHLFVGYAAPQGIASTFAEARQYKTAAAQVQFDIRTRPYFGNFSVNGDVWRRYKYTGNKGLVMDEVARNSKLLMMQAKNDFASYIHGNGVAALGRMTAASSVASATVTLRAGADARRIEYGMYLQTESTGATGGTINSGYVQVSSTGGTDSAPTVTVSQASWATGIPAAAASDYIYRAGTYDSVFYGLDAWMPSHSGSPGTFLGANRNLSPYKLAGNVLDGTKMGPKQRLFRAARMVQDTGYKPNTAILSTRNWENLYTELTAQNALKMTKVPAAKISGVSFGIEYDAIELIGPGGRIEVFADPWAPDDIERVGDRSVLKLCSTGPLIHWDEGSTPGDPRVEDGTDSRECRLVGDIAFTCEAPWAWCRIAVTA